MPGTIDLTGRVVLITGGTRGLGRAMADGLAAVGARIAVASRDAEACARTAQELTERYGQGHFGQPCHVGRWGDIETLVETVLERFSKIDVLINNAGMSPLYDSLETVSEELFDKVLGVNLKGPFRLASLVGAHMKATGGGSIINVSSTASVRPRPEVVPYAAAKAGLNAMTLGMAHAFGPSVRVNAILAGTFLTDVSKHWDQEAFRRRAATFALRRGGEPNEIVGTALYLASDLSSYTTGALITVDGGAQ